MLLRFVSEKRIFWKTISVYFYIKCLRLIIWPNFVSEKNHEIRAIENGRIVSRRELLHQIYICYSKTVINTGQHCIYIHTPKKKVLGFFSVAGIEIFATKVRKSWKPQDFLRNYMFNVKHHLWWLWGEGHWPRLISIPFDTLVTGFLEGASQGAL